MVTEPGRAQQAQDALVGDHLIQATDQPVVADSVEKFRQIHVDDVGFAPRPPNLQLGEE